MSALVGYVLGTLQVLLVDWFRRRTAHRQQLLVLRSDLRNAATCISQFGWKETGEGISNALPRAPFVSPVFFVTVSATDFTLTDEYADDNTQQALLAITSGFEMLAYHRQKVEAYADDIRNSTDPARKADARKRGIAHAVIYDRELDGVLFLIDDALRDLNRRVQASSFWGQLRRPLGALPQGVAPVPLTADDPRVKAFATRLRGGSTPDAV